MSVYSGPEVSDSGLLFSYDIGNTQKSWRGAPTTNMISSQSLGYGLYAYATGPVDTTTSGHREQGLTVKRYTISSAVNSARAAFYPSSLTTSTNYVFSVFIRYNGSQSPSFHADASKGNPEGGANNNSFNTSTLSSVSYGNGWYRISYLFNFSSCPTGKCILTFGIITGSDSSYVNNTFDVYDAQLEINSFATPYINGTRSNTQAIVDLTGNNTITANSLTYASDGTFSFNGSSNFITLGNDSNLIQGNQITVESWVKTNELGSYKKIFTNGNATGVYLSLGPSPFNTYFGVVTNSSSGSAVWTSNISTLSFTHLVGTYNGSICRLYVNGEEKASGAASGTMGTGSTVYVSGYESGSERWNGLISTLKVYNRALTAQEVAQNFQALRGRYGI